MIAPRARSGVKPSAGSRDLGRKPHGRRRFQAQRREESFPRSAAWHVDDAASQRCFGKALTGRSQDQGQERHWGHRDLAWSSFLNEPRPLRGSNPATRAEIFYFHGQTVVQVGSTLAASNTRYTAE